MTTYPLKTPVGILTLVAHGAALKEIRFEEETLPPRSAATEDREAEERVFERTSGQLEEYFEGRRTRFDLPLAPHGTAFQLRVWEQLSAIPFGSTTSYGELARRLGNPGAARAIGLANGSNPLPIVVPCHRVIGASGDLTGYGGGLVRKRWLLAHEGALDVDPPPRLF